MQDTHATTKTFTIALLGNPNCGKSSVFNQLTGLRQKVGNFPGVTVDKKIGQTLLPDQSAITLVDFPGTYSFYPTSIDERIVAQSLCNPQDANYPDGILYIADVTKLEKHLLLLTQLRDLGLPIILGLNMSDVAKKDGLKVDTGKLSRQLNVKAVQISGRTGEGMKALKGELQRMVDQRASYIAPKPLFRMTETERNAAEAAKAIVPNANTYQGLLIAHHYEWLPFLSDAQRTLLTDVAKQNGFESLRAQVDETMQRFDKFTPIVRSCIQTRSEEGRSSTTEKLDRILTHRFFGPIIFFTLMLLVFQAIFAWATYPMDIIEGFFGYSGEWIKTNWPEGWWGAVC